MTLDEALSRLDLDTAPAIGPSITANATALGDPDPLNVATHALFHPVMVPIVDKTGVNKPALFIPGHVRDGQLGPAYGCPVMVIGNIPTAQEQQRLRLFTGPAGAFLWSALEELNIDTEDWYVTNAIRFAPPIKIKKPRDMWVKDCTWMLHQEVRMVQPKVIVAMGAVAIKALFGKAMTLEKCRGSTELFYQGIPVVVAQHPMNVIMDPNQRPNFLDDLRRVEKTLAGSIKFDFSTCDYKIITDEKALAEQVDKWIAEGHEWFSVDCEWGSEKFNDWIHGELRSVQISVKAKSGVAIALRGPNLIPIFTPAPTCCESHLKRLLERDTVRLVGHNLRADMKWLQQRLGLKLEKQYLQGFDTASGYHLLNPSQGKDVGLEKLALKFTEFGRYDWDLERWKEENHINRAVLNTRGYADIPNELLLPYGIKDVDVTIQLLPILMQKLKETKFEGYGPYMYDDVRIENLLDLHQTIIHPVGLALDELEVTGFPVDPDRMIDLVDLFHVKQAEMLTEFRELINWPDFNHRSPDQVRELMFNFHSCSQLSEDPDVRARAPEFVRPMTAVCLQLAPLKTTEKPSRNWDDVPASEQLYVSPSTDSETLQTYSATNPTVKKLANIRFLDQMIKNFLRKPDDVGELEEQDKIVDVEKGEVVTAEPVWSKGLLGCMDEDTRIRTNVSLFTETGRYRSSSPNLQNLPSKQEAKLIEIFCTDVTRLKATPDWESLPFPVLKELQLLELRYFPLRTCFVADPGCVLIEADYKQAELNVLASISGDETMQQIMSDPKRDLHCEMAVRGLRLPCKPEEVKKKYPMKRYAAKTTNFGILYGRGSSATVRAMHMLGLFDFTLSDADALRDALFETCPQAHRFIEAKHECVYNPGYVENPFGRRRYFAETDDKRIRAEQERQAVNMPIQGTVADVLSVALYNLYRYKREWDTGVKYEILVPVHDAVILHVPVKYVDKVVQEVLPLCMTELAPVPHINLRLGIDITISTRWGLKQKKDEAIKAALMAA